MTRICSLRAQENCVQVPKEVCSRMRRNPRIIKRPIVKKWCFTPSADDEDEEPIDLTAFEGSGAGEAAIETQQPEEEGDMDAQAQLPAGN